jgi:hypothetical protein
MPTSSAHTPQTQQQHPGSVSPLELLGVVVRCLEVLCAKPDDAEALEIAQCLLTLLGCPDLAPMVHQNPRRAAALLVQRL